MNAGVNQLLDLARDNSVAGRTALVGAVSDLYFDRAAGHGEAERALMTNILRQLIHDVEMSVRCALSARLADHDSAPRELVIILASDQIEAAYPILSRSAVLEDNDLLVLIRERADEHRLAIAMRQSVSALVSDALVAGGSEGVIETLLENRGAEISAATMAYLVEQSRRVDAYRGPLLDRSDLGPDLARRMYGWVSAALRRHILENFEIDPGTLDGALDATIKQAEAETAAASDQRGQAGRELAGHLQRGGVISPRFLIQTLREGEVPLFEAMFAKYTGIEPKLARQVVYEPGGRGLAIACKAVRIEKADFATLLLLSRQGRLGDQIVEPKELNGALAFFDILRPDGAAAVVKRWRKDPDYMAAIRALKGELTVAS